jgi:hypothetical protein
VLQSNVDIVASVSMPQIAADCSNRPPYYGGAAPHYALSNVANAPHANALYPAALANALAGFDLQPDYEDITITLNEGADHGCEAPWSGWWYGTDAGTPPPSSRIPMFVVMLHEFGHGLGFGPLYNVATGASPSSGQPIWGWYLYDVSAGKLWKDMTDAERAASVKNDPNLVWSGPDTSRWVDKFLSHPIDLIVNAPAGFAGTYTTNVSNAGVPLRSALTSNVVVVDDGNGDTRDGCDIPFANATEIAGKIALMDGYNCSVSKKIHNAQSQGMAAILIANVNANGPMPMYATGENIRIPAYGIAQTLGNAIFAAPASFNATLTPRTDLDAYGAKDGCARIHAPTTLAPGSSGAHFSGDGVPTMLMQVNGPIALYQVGLSLNLLHDIGWKTRAEDGLFVDGFDGSPCAHARRERDCAALTTQPEAARRGRLRRSSRTFPQTCPRHLWKTRQPMIRATAFLRVIRKWNNADTDASARPCDAHSTRFAMKTATRLRTRPLAAALITGLGLGMHATGAFAATQIAVTTADDAGSSSTCTLRQAITAMNGGGVTTGTACVASTISGVDTITFDTTAFRRTARTRSRSRMRQQPLSITDANLVIDASANGNVTVQRSANAANAFGIFYASGHTAR